MKNNNDYSSDNDILPEIDISGMDFPDSFTDEPADALEDEYSRHLDMLDDFDDIVIRDDDFDDFDDLEINYDFDDADEYRGKADEYDEFVRASEDYDEYDDEEDEYYDEEDSESDYSEEDFEDEYEEKSSDDEFTVDLSDFDFDDDKTAVPVLYDKKNSGKGKGAAIVKRKENLPSTEVEEDFSEYYDYSEEDFEEGKKKHPFLRVLGILFLLLVLFSAFIVFTTPGHKLAYKIAAKFIHESTNSELITDAPLPTLAPEVLVNDDEINPDSKPLDALDDPVDGNSSPYRSEDYVKTFLLFGIEEIDGASNTDTIMLASVNTKDNSIKLTSILRDTYVEIPGYYPNKINAAYAYGCKTGETSEERRANGAKMLITVIERTYDVDISGYAYVNFNSFEKIIDRLGGIDIELGKTEAAYLNKTNYISNPAYRNVSVGMNHLNGNQALGYCRVRKVATLGGANNDYGRTVRQRRVISAIVNQYKNSDLMDMIPILRDCLGYIKTSLTEEQIEELLYDVFENRTFTINQMRLPTEELFRDSGKKGIFNGKYNVTYTLVIDDYREENIKKFHQFLFLDEEPAAVADETVTQ